MFIALAAMLMAPALIWAGLWYVAQSHQILRLTAAVVLPPALAVASLAFIVMSEPNDGMVDESAYYLTFIFPFVISIGVAGFCEAWAGRKRK